MRQGVSDSDVPLSMQAPMSCNDTRGRRTACTVCRVRRVKCVPGPTKCCERCTTVGFISCVYEPTMKRGMGKTLPRGEACKHCRARKRKCDAKRPCTRCVFADRALECEYDTVFGHPEYAQFAHWGELDPSGSSDVSAQERGFIGGEVPGVFTNTSLVAVTQPAPEAIPPTHTFIHSLGRNSTSLPMSPRSQLHVFSEVQAHNPPHALLPPFSVLLSLKKSSGIPPEPHITLLSLGAGRFQLSDAALGELDMKFRLRALCRLNKFGIYFTSRKQQALLRGDTSGTIIHPFFIPAAQSLGMHFCEGMDDSPAMIRLQAKHLQTSLEILAEISKGHDLELRAQYLQRTCETIDAAGLRFIPAYGRPPEFSEDLHEKLSVLSQAMYFENFIFLTCGGAEPIMTARIEQEFRNQLQEVYPILFKICPLTMRTRTILLVRDTILALNCRPTKEVQFGVWIQSCDQLVYLLDNYSRTLLSNLQRFQELGDKSGAGMIRSSCVNCLAHLAALCEALGQAESIRTRSEALCDSTLERLCELARGMSMEEYTRLDLLLGVSWKKALGVLDARIATASPACGKKLRYWKEVIADVYSDFSAKLPDAELPTLAMRASWEDGRTEGSRYPNLLLREAMEEYGI